ncbi:permease [Clostridium gelidum]|uniref:Permease n=1 Tax=Clostridium gelidum TaxID=704125 RepID=A0ABM7T711_9CLOT|nr:AEC family transporter [Clostridium gelidum]BCZ47802.1 permease [Clostridium gelidum]
MKEVMVKSLGFICIVILGYILKKNGFFKKEDGLFLSKIVMNITLPAALIAGASSMNINYVAIIIILVGLISNLFNIFLVKYIERRNSPVTKAISIINCSGYNVGNFAIPFAASFFEPTALLYMCMFDMGNSCMVLGGSYALAKNEVDGSGRLNIKKLIKTLLRTVPFDVLIVLFVISILKISIPKEITTIASMIGSANAFLAMLMIGIILEINITKTQAKGVTKLLGIRYFSNLIFSCSVYFFLPVPILAKQMIVLVLFAPLSTISAVYSKMIDPDNPIPALANSISIILGIFIMTGLLIVFT